MRFDSGLLVHSGDVSNYPPVAEWTETLRMMETAGFTTVWCAEHHFFWDGWLQPTPTNPLLFGAFAVNITERLRLGQCGVCLPDWHPIRVAEDVAMLDHMSGGRVDFGMIRGLNSRVNGNFNRDGDRRDTDRVQSLFWESYEVIRQAWENKPLRHQGRFYQLPVPGWFDKSVDQDNYDSDYYSAEGELLGLGVLPKPYQQPNPPSYVMADSASSTMAAAQRGLGVISFAQSLGASAQISREYRRQFVPGAMSRPSFGVMRPMYVAKSSAEADRVLRPSINELMAHISGGYSSIWSSRQAFLAPGDELSAADREADWYDFLVSRQWCFVGTPDAVAEQLSAYQAEGIEHVVGYWALPFMTFDQMMASQKLLADEVMPRFTGSTS
jgi:alkanesulfonate monooxygenase SsuD/methylene tetrahydromethanopterin reductase-like flavin-dependent oxidoreductase (luciferase family)